MLSLNMFSYLLHTHVGRPNIQAHERCVLMSQWSGQWSDALCTEKKDVLCEKGNTSILLSRLFEKQNSHTSGLKFINELCIFNHCILHYYTQNG